MSADAIDSSYGAGSRVTRAAVRKLRAEGLIGADAEAAALASLPSPLPWPEWTRRLLAFVGTALVLAGVVIFFAANWQSLHRFVKLGMIVAVLAACAAGAVVQGLDVLAAKLLLLASTVLVGALLAVFGQAYQTGADAWQLFAAWAVLAAPWAIASRFAAHVVTWLAISDAAILLAWHEIADDPAERWVLAGACVSAAALDVAALVTGEVLALRGAPWLADPWPRRVLVLASLLLLLVPTVQLVHDAGGASIASALGGAAFVSSIVAGVHVYRRVAHDLPALATIALVACLALLDVAWKLLNEVTQGESTALFWLAMGVATLVVLGLAAFWLSRVAAEVSRG